MIVVESPAPKKGGRKGKKGEVVDLGLGAELGFEGQAEMEEAEGWEKVSLDFEPLSSFCAVKAGGLTRGFRSDGGNRHLRGKTPTVLPPIPPLLPVRPPPRRPGANQS